MKLILVLAGFAIVLLRGWAKIANSGEGGLKKGMEKALFTAIIAVSAYIAIAGMRSWPVWTPVRFFRAGFVPLGRWLEWVLGSE
ncbi:hypothetical protein [Cohnella sp. AR92]|uniref:hypothetical protein n=1 Tax=Cohnella sp. AR92 TaxID=648716 RepID=UPI000F8DAA6E|nr:hypothetical protein [Cohnella sp. AR92]RUS46764.1 hypothetical protein ELR57_13805 [Cohnella sp. AR92]